jgi:2-polyprenyl-6-methoxyphenol hydroxylase-like FAD-dependent oxidoreductase
LKTNVNESQKDRLTQDASKFPLPFSLIPNLKLQRIENRKRLTDTLQVLVVGAGPSGLVLALLLAKAGIKTTLLDAAPTLDDRPRAAHYAPSAVRVLKAAGVLEDVRRDGLIPKNMTWRKIDGSVITSITDVAQSWTPDALTVLPLNMLGEVLLRHCEANENVEVRWNKKVVDVGSDSKEAWALVKNEDGQEEMWTADYICGCDGANSAVRKSLFGNEFPGKTWDAQIIATNVPPPSSLPFPCY